LSEETSIKTLASVTSAFTVTNDWAVAFRQAHVEPVPVEEQLHLEDVDTTEQDEWGLGSAHGTVQSFMDSMKG